MGAQTVGADADHLDRVAVELRAAADELDGHNSALTSLLGSIEWVGEVANRFVGAWSGAHRVNLSSTSQYFRTAADQLSRNAGEQREASGSVGGGLGSGSGAGGWRPSDGGDGGWGFGWPGWPSGGEWVGLGLQGTLAGMEGLFTGYRNGAGAWKSGYGWIWNEHTRQGVRASFADDVLRPLFKAGLVLDVGLSAYEGALHEYGLLASDPTLDGAESSARVAGAGLATGAVALGGAVAGAKVGAAVGSLVGPPLGTVVGGVAGAAVGAGVAYGMSVEIGGNTIGGHIGNAGAEVGDALVDGARFVGEGVSDAGEAVGDVMADVGGGIADAADKVWPW